MSLVRRRPVLLAVVVALSLTAVAASLYVWLASNPAEETVDPNVVATSQEDASLFAMDLSPSAPLVAAAYTKSHAESRSHYIKVWDFQTNKQVARLEESGEVNALAFSADGRLLASAAEPGVVRLRDTRSWREHSVLRVHVQFPGPLAFSPDDKTLAVGGGTDGYAVLWNLDPAAARASLPGHKLGVEHLAFAPDGKHVVSLGARGPILVWTNPDGVRVSTLEPDPLSDYSPVGFMGLAFAPDSLSFATAGADNVLRVWQLRDGEEKDAHPRQSLAIPVRAYSADGRQRLGLTSLAYSPDGGVLAVGCSNTYGRPGRVQVRDVPTMKRTTSMVTRPGFVRFLRFVKDGSVLVVGTEGGRESHIEVWDLRP